MKDQLGKKVTQKNLHSLLLRWECEILAGTPPEWEIVEQIPFSELRRSSLLMKSYGEQLISCGQLPEAEPVLLDAAKGLAGQGMRRHFLSALALLAIVYIRTGRSAEAETLLHFLLAEWKEEKESLDGYVALALAQGSCLIEMQSSWPYYYSAMRRFADDGAPDHCCYTALSFLIESDVQPLQQQWHTAEAYIVQQSVISRQGSRYAAYAQGLRYLRSGQWDLAIPALEKAGQDDASDVRYFSVMLRISLVRAKIHSENNYFRKNIMELLSSSLENDHDLYLRFAYGCLLAEMYSSEGNVNAANEELMKLKSLAALCRNPMQANIVSSLEANLASNAAISAISLADLETASASARPSQADSARSTLSWTVHSFGQLAFTCGQIEVRHIRWGRRKAFELFAYLLLRPHYSALKELAADVLFPETPPQKLNNQLHVTVHHLRQVLGDYLNASKGVVLQDGVIRLREDLFEQSDYEKFMALSKVGDQLWIAERELAADMYDQAVQLYAELFPDLQSIDWLDRIRESLLERQSSMLRKLGRHALDHGESERAEMLYAERIRLNYLHEEAYQDMIEFHLAIGNQSGAAYWYDKLERICVEELGTVPSAETRHMMKSLRTF